MPELVEYISYGKIGPSLESRELDFAAPKIPQTRGLSVCLENFSEEFIVAVDNRRSYRIQIALPLKLSQQGLKQSPLRQ